MAERHVISALKKRREQLARDMFRLRNDIAHIDAAITLMEPDYKPASARHGILTRLIFATLRKAGEPLTIPQLVEQIGASPKQIKDALTEQRRKGVIRRIANAGQLLRWEIAP